MDREGGEEKGRGTGEGLVSRSLLTHENNLVHFSV